MGMDAKNALTELLHDKTVHLRLLYADQYGRAVADVWVQPYGWWWPFARTHADEYMLHQGLAEVYMGSGAVYGPQGKDYYLQLQEQARSDRKGIWSVDGHETAAEYKRRTKGE
jgi:endonuclease YncB( thermonuclease family)